MAKKKARPSSPNTLDYPDSMSLYERESLVAEAKLAAERKIRKRPKPSSKSKVARYRAVSKSRTARKKTSKKDGRNPPPAQFGDLKKGPIMTLVPVSKKLSKFDPKKFLSTINGGRKIDAFPKKRTIFAQGDSGDAVFYIKDGKVKLTVVSEIGKEATIGILNKGDFFGEGCLTGQPLRLCSATAMTDCSVMRIDKKSMVEVLRREHAFSDMFVAYLLTRNIRYEEDLVDQLFNSSEKRLARILLLLAHFGKDGKPETLIPKMSQETLAEMIGTTRSRVSFFMNRFRKLGFIDYDGGSGLQVHSSLLNIVLHD
jgi:CRP/FNR family cyclic AMP-dependent transcriptional regulator